MGLQSSRGPVSRFSGMPCEWLLTTIVCFMKANHQRMFVLPQTNLVFY